MDAASMTRQTPQSDSFASLERRFELARTEITIAGRRYSLLRPRNIDDLISEEDFAIDERIPYWAECWPSGRVLAERIATVDGRGKSLLELGCGIGALALAAAAAGFEVLATDYYADALEFTAANAELHDLPNVDTRLVDWRRLPGDLGMFDFVVAADVLYEAPQADLIASVIAQTLAMDGVAWISDPGRRTAPLLLDACDRHGLTAECDVRVGATDAGAELHVSIYRVRWRGGENAT
jgi:predicted nicotinamide N-methyase